MNKKQLAALKKSGNWMIRCSNEGVAYGGFKWPDALDEWCEAPDWIDGNTNCGHGLHGQTKENNGFCSEASRIELCEYDVADIVILNDKIKCKRARIVAVNENIPSWAFENVSLKIKCYKGGSLNNIKQIGGDLYFYSNAKLDALQSVGGNLYFYSNAKLDAVNLQSVNNRPYKKENAL